MRKLLFLLLLLPFIGKTQFSPTPGQFKIITINGDTYRIFVPTGWTSSTPGYYFHVAFYGQGQTDGNSLSGEEPGTYFSTPYNWDGTVHMADGSIKKFIIFGIPNYGNFPHKYADAIDSTIKAMGTSIDTSHHERFSTSAFSLGPGYMWVYLTNDAGTGGGVGSAGITTPNRLIFQNTVTMSPTVLGVYSSITPRSAGGRHWVLYSANDPNSGTPPVAATGFLYPALSAPKNLTNIPLNCHCIWDSAMSPYKAMTQFGGNANNNVWRWLVDANDGLSNIPPTANAGSDQNITLPTSSVTFSGSGSDADGSIASYSWSQISGPNTGTITSASSSSTTVTGLIQGTYVFRLTVTDNQGATGFDDIQVIVNAAAAPPPFNISPNKQVKYKFGTDSILVWVPKDTSLAKTKYYFIYNNVDSNNSTFTEDSAFVVGRGLAYKIANGWSAVQKLTTGDSASFFVMTPISNCTDKLAQEKVLDSFMNRFSRWIDSSAHNRMGFTAIGMGGNFMANYMLNFYVNQGLGNCKYRSIFTRYIPVGMTLSTLNTNTWATLPTINTWTFTGDQGDVFPYFHAVSLEFADSANNRNPTPNNKISVLQGFDVKSKPSYDSAYSSVGLDASSNVFRWFVDPLDGINTTTFPLASLINTNKGMMYDLTLANKPVSNLLDKDTLTYAFQDFFNGYLLDMTGGVYKIWIVLDSFYNYPKVEVFNGAFSGGGPVTVQFFYDPLDTTRHSPVYTTNLITNSWTGVDTAHSRQYTDSSRFMMLTIGSLNSNNFAEMRIYGNKLGIAPSILPAPSAPPPDEGKFFQGYNKVFGDTAMDDAALSQRLNNNMTYIDTNAIDGSGHNLALNKFSNLFDNTLSVNNRQGRSAFIYFSGPRQAYIASGDLSNNTKDIVPGSDSSKFASWGTTDSTYFGVLGKWGYTLLADISRYTYVNAPPGVGVGGIHEIEIGNEDDARWVGNTRFHSPLVKLMKVKQGAKGAHAADPTCKVWAGALTGADTMYVKTLYLENYINFHTKVADWDGNNFNYYATSSGVQAVPGAVGVSPEQDRSYTKWVGMKNVYYRYYPGKPVHITEWGYDTSNTLYRVANIAGQTRGRTQSDWLIRGYEWGALSGINRMYMYTQRNLGGGDFSSTGFSSDTFLVNPGNTLPLYLQQFLSAGALAGGGWVSLPTTPYWWMTCRLNVLMNYKAQPTLIQNGDSTGISILKYTHVTDANLSVYPIWYGTTNNSSSTNFILNSPGAKSAVLIRPVVGIKTGTSTTLVVVNGNITVPLVDETVGYVVVSNTIFPTNVRNYMKTNTHAKKHKLGKG